MTQVLQFEERRIQASIARLAESFECSRQTVVKKLGAAGVKPSGKRHGHPVYPIKESAAALLGFNAAAAREKTADGEVNPRELNLDERRKWYEVEAKRLAYEVQAKELIPATQVEHEMSILVSAIAQFLETLPDMLERDIGLTPDQVVQVQRTVLGQQQKLYESISSNDQLSESRTG